MFFRKKASFLCIEASGIHKNSLPGSLTRYTTIAAASHTHLTQLPPQTTIGLVSVEEMETAVGAASWLVGKVVDKLSNDLVAAYVASSELGLNAGKINADLLYTQGLLHASKGREDNPGLKGLLDQLSRKADEAEDALDELHYFMIQDKLDGTRHAAPDLGGDLQEKVQHARNAIQHTSGNWLSCFPCCRPKDGDSIATTVANNPQNQVKSDSAIGTGHVDNLTFDRVAMSMKIKSVMEDIHSCCTPVSDLLKITSNSYPTGTVVTLKRPLIGSSVVQDKLYGRGVIFEQTIKDLTTGLYHGETLSVLPIVGPGGIGKTTFTQHLYNDTRTEEHFAVRVWVCVSTDFDVLKLTRQIHSSIPATEKEESNIINETTNLNQIQLSIANRLKFKRFLLILDDIWKVDSDDEWKSLLAPFRKGEAKGSMVLVTTRFPKIGEMVKKATIPINLQGLDPWEFLEFFLACVFDENSLGQQHDELIEIGVQIAMKLKCSPLAAKTVARLLKKHLTWEHWRGVLENNEWKNQTNSDDIMPALKISYDNLPFELKQCFSYFSLFPEDHRFKNLEITRFWTSIGIIDSSCKNINYLEDLRDNGFLMKEGDYPEDQCYVMHDLLHELSRIVSSHQCANISSLSFNADDIPETIQHLSITIRVRDDETFRKEMAKLKRKINIGSLRTLMICGGYGYTTCMTLNELFEEIENLRVLFIGMDSRESLPKKFSKLLHLRYLKLISGYDQEITLPSTLSRFYHLLYLDLKDWRGSSNLPKHISRLVNLRHFIADSELHSNVPEVGKMEHLEELEEFHVKKESVGYGVEQLGTLSNLEGKLRVLNLEKVTTKEEASRARLGLKRNLKTLQLVWDGVQQDGDADVVEGLQPHASLRELTIENHSRGATSLPSWLCDDLRITHLESLTLEGVWWVTSPPFGQLPYLKRLVLKRIVGVRCIGPHSGHSSFMHLKEVEISGMQILETWTVEPTCNVFPMLESIDCSDCPNLLALPFWPDSCVSCPRLHNLRIFACPKLLLPPMPPSPALTSIDISDNIYRPIKTTVQRVVLANGILSLNWYRGAVAFHNMNNIVDVHCTEGSITGWTDPREATSVRTLRFEDSSIQSLAFISGLKSLTSLALFNCGSVAVDEHNPLITSVSLKEVMVANDLKHPSSLAVDLFSGVAGRTKPLPAGSFLLGKLCLDSISAVLVAPICSLLAATLHTLMLCDYQRVEILTEDEEKALQLLTSLQNLVFRDCLGLPSLPQGLHNLSCLGELTLIECPEIRCLPMGGLPTSLRYLEINGCSAKLKEQLKKLQETNTELRVTYSYNYKRSTYG